MENMLGKTLIERCNMKLESFTNLGETIKTSTGPYTFIDNGSNVLGVAHLDYVLWKKPRIKNGTIYCPQLDDRLGVWTLLDLLPYLQCKPFDVLLTDSEETGQSTGQFFKPNKQYNWIFSFDRAGDNVVLYDYDDTITQSLMEQYGYKVENGTFSDISLMKLNCKGFNFGVGYHNQHTKFCYANIQDTINNAQAFCTFMDEKADTLLEHDHSTDWNRQRTYTNSVNWWHSNIDYCEVCGNSITNTNWNYCPYCGDELKTQLSYYDKDDYWR